MNGFCYLLVHFIPELDCLTSGTKIGYPDVVKNGNFSVLVVNSSRFFQLTFVLCNTFPGNLLEKAAETCLIFET